MTMWQIRGSLMPSSKIREMRQAAGMTLQDVAAKVGKVVSFYRQV